MKQTKRKLRSLCLLGLTLLLLCSLSLPAGAAEDNAIEAGETKTITAEAGETDKPTLLEDDCAHTDADNDGICDICGEEILPASGSCGEAVSWTLDSAGILRIFGEGPMEDYDIDDWDNRPSWYSVRDQITRLVVEEGVTTIGNDDWLFYKIKLTQKKHLFYNNNIETGR